MSLKASQGSGRILVANNRVQQHQTSTVVSSAGSNHHTNTYNTALMTELDQALEETPHTFRHKDLLKNLLNVLKMNDLIEEYRDVVRNLQFNCGCKKNKYLQDHLASLEQRYTQYQQDDYKNIAIAGPANTLSSASSSSVNTGKHQICGVQKMNNSNSTSLKTTPTAATSNNNHNNSKSSSLNFAGFNQSLKNNGTSNTNNNGRSQSKNHQMQQQQQQQECEEPSKQNVARNGAKYMDFSYGRSMTEAIPIIGDEEEITEEDEVEVEQEFDIEEYVQLTAILEKDNSKLVRERDSKNDFIMVVRDNTTRDTVCFECIVGGKCGFLSRERNRMLLHISKHFESDNMTSDEEEEDEDSKDIDISIIPVNPEDILHDDRPMPDMSDKMSVSDIKLQFMQIQQEHDLKKLIYCNWPNCNFNCDQNYKLRTHIRQVHQKLRPYLCDWPGCFGAYKTRSNLASHRMVHTGERPFVCDFQDCGARFARKYDCERHRRIHCEKMFACEWPGCGKRLCDPYNLERHMMVHKGELPYRCPIGKCIRGFRELRYLRDHMINTHQCLPDTAQLKMAYMKSDASPMEDESDSNRSEETLNEPEEKSIVKKLLISGINQSINPIPNNVVVNSKSPPLAVPKQVSQPISNSKKTYIILKGGIKRPATVVPPNLIKAGPSKTFSESTKDNPICIEPDDDEDDEQQQQQQQQQQQSQPLQTQQPSTDKNNNNIVSNNKNIKNIKEESDNDNHDNRENTSTKSATAPLASVEEKKDEPMSTRRSKRVRNK